MTLFFYVRFSLLISMYMGWLQGAFNVLKELFNWVKMWKNV